MNFITIDQWDEEIWRQASFIYTQAFGKSGAKPEKIIGNMFAKQLCFLHVVIKENEVIAMALTGKLEGTKALLIDYLAVRDDYRNQGIGHKLLHYIKGWCITQGNFDSIMIEVEADKTPENLKRIHFWEKSNFQLTDYIHQYIWVPEPYQAMYLKLLPEAKIPTKGEQLFQYIIHFHKDSFRLK
ncbi:MAG TPA: GNAT family N-acetyltransferase [Pseudoneobacillus sp.]|nr:GNAT family N-acetyltransferase [Pseudoneobacillus sp.]